jgi:ABC-type transport system involved in multi-copper enzyme maturation permease subunit
MGVQLAGVLGVPPGLRADAIASERRRKTLDDLMTTPMTGGAIARGKLAARLVELGAFSAMLVPITSLLTLFGGVSPAGVALGYVALGATAFFVGSLALLVAVLSRRVRVGFTLAYALTAAWLIVPEFVSGATGFRVLDSLLGWTWPARPWGLLGTGRGSILGGDLAGAARETAWMVGSLVFYGGLLLLLAGWQLRAAHARQGGSTVRGRSAARGGVRWVRIPPCGDDPVFWKEAYISRRAGGSVGLVLRGLVFLALIVALGAALYGAKEAVLEIGQSGYAYRNGSNYDARMAFNVGLRAVGALAFWAWSLWLAGTTASSLASEHEQDTWISLLATPLDRDEILYGKMLGSLWGSAPIGGVLLACWVLGLAVGSVHPLGLINAVVTAAVSLWFVVALGIYCSSRSKVAWRARAWAQGLLMATHFCVCFVLPIPSVTVLVGLAPWSYIELDEGFSSIRDPLWGVAVYLTGCLLVYGFLAFWLTRLAGRRFDHEADRPRRPAPPILPAAAAKAKAARRDELG